jgi:hypothetical protein
MKTQDAIEHYGGIPALAAALSVTIPAVYQWGEYPPGGRQLQIQHVTKGALQAEPDCMVRKSEKAQ